jgi:hypothetical protein
VYFQPSKRGLPQTKAKIEQSDPQSPPKNFFNFDSKKSSYFICIRTANFYTSGFDLPDFATLSSAEQAKPREKSSSDGVSWKDPTLLGRSRKKTNGIQQIAEKIQIIEDCTKMKRKSEFQSGPRVKSGGRNCRIF